MNTQITDPFEKELIFAIEKIAYKSERIETIMIEMNQKKQWETRH